MSTKHFVFLQGMPSPFFKRLGEALAVKKHKITRINLCVGDWLFWSGPDCISYRGSYGDWPQFIGTLFDQQAVTDVVLLGEQRRYHKEAVQLAQERGIRVTVNDFGYLRPDWITLERDGMGGNSRFPRDPEEIHRRSANLPVAQLAQQYRDSPRAMMRADLLYNFSNLFLGVLFPHYRRTDRRPHTLIYTLTSAKQLVLMKWRQKANYRKIEEILQDKGGYFLLPLQLDHDFQIVAYSPFKGMSEVIRLAIESFSRFAKIPQRLVIKVHPWDAGLVNWEKIIQQIAREFSVDDRVDYLDGGSLDGLLKHAQGMITVNSTAGLHALQSGCSVKVLGQAVYDVPGLTFQGTLNAFWSQHVRPDAALLNAFVNLMASSIQLRGVFFSEPGCSLAVAAAAQKLEAMSFTANGISASTRNDLRSLFFNRS